MELCFLVAKAPQKTQPRRTRHPRPSEGPKERYQKTSDGFIKPIKVIGSVIPEMYKRKKGEKIGREHSINAFKVIYAIQADLKFYMDDDTYSEADMMEVQSALTNYIRHPQCCPMYDHCEGAQLPSRAKK